MTSPDTADETLLLDDGELVLLRTGSGRLLRRARGGGAAARRLLEAEYAWRGRLQPAWAAVPSALELDAPWPQLHLQDPGGEPLAGLLEQPWPLERFLAVAVAMARALGRLHAAGLVHRDLHPARLLVQPGRAGPGCWASPMRRKRHGPMATPAAKRRPGSPMRRRNSAAAVTVRPMPAATSMPSAWCCSRC
ncbi:hypothetical protein [Aquincola sp. J276]|uniref:hypothetical protein n=1 Tax=Aquincola sp. J276 TaxID=2898432 RepID=UPI002150BE9B|nr:hypothetical protein [Aquincola sp. J276]MCR5864441.1 hypothetical protein [Aquincola sp. J276]